MTRADRSLDRRTKGRRLIRRNGGRSHSPNGVAEDKRRFGSDTSQRISRRAPDRTVAARHADRRVERGPDAHPFGSRGRRVQQERDHETNRADAQQRGGNGRPARAELAPTVLNERDEQTREEREK